ncbi:rve-domain-containing protein, partial [Punctularia strigosozonata HHB-11173 SS5]|uniref:rve-domain-containing protein n=1 Tax=Punctularia strigosozonata (strain HHB-11173) TaxID=741275 RepID=UPI0004416796
VDDFSSRNWTFLLKSKSDALELVKGWHARTARQVGYSLGTLRIDNGKLKSSAFDSFCASSGITLEYTAPYTSAENGKVERMHGTLMGCARAMREASGLPLTLWGEFALTAGFLANYIPSASLPRGITPLERWYGRKPDVSFLHEIGCTAYALIQNVHNPKILGCSIRCVLVGYESHSKAYRLWHPEGRRLISTRNVCF